MNDTGKELTTAEAAALLGVDVRTVQRMVKDGRLTPLKTLPFGRGAHLFAEADVARIAAGRVA